MNDDRPYCLQHINCISSAPECPWCEEGAPPTPDNHILGIKNEGIRVYADGRVEDTTEWYTFADFKKNHPEWYPV